MAIDDGGTGAADDDPHDGAARVVAAFDAADDADDAGASDADLAAEWNTDLGNARRLVARHGRDLKFVREIGWLAWDGHRWDFDDAEPLRRAHLVARDMIKEAIAIKAAGARHDEDDDAFDARVRGHFAWAYTSSNHARAQAMILSAAPYLALRRDDLDRHEYRINVRNCTLVLDGVDGNEVRVTRRNHARADHATKIADVDYDPNASAPGWHAFMADVLPDVATRRFVQVWLGYCLTGSIAEQCMAVFEGGGSNGKSTVIDVVARILGDYAVTVPVETFLHKEGRGGSGPTPDLARLAGARLVRTSEPDPGARLSESTIKQFTGGERITARHLFKDMFEFRPQGKLTLSTNIRPTIVGKDHGIRRRIKVVPFRQMFAPKAGRGEGLTETLLHERSGILNWLLDGYRLWREDGLDLSPAIQRATAAYFEEMDPIGSFVADVCELGPTHTEFATTLQDAYKRWCAQSSEEEKNATAFGRRLNDMGFGKIKTAGVIKRTGLRVRDEWKGHGSPAARVDDE